MSIVAVKNLKEGWVLHEDVRDVNGRLMLAKGHKIDANHIRVFKIWGVSEVSVREDDVLAPDIDADKDIEKLRGIEQTTEIIMQNIDISHPVVSEIYRTAVEHRYQNDLIIDFKNRRKIPEKFKMDLSGGFRAQIEFGDIKLPDAPEIILDFKKVIEDPFSSSNDIAEVVKRSPSLTALLLKLVNSAFYGFPSKIDTISQAVSLIGTREINALILGVTVMRQFHDISNKLVDVSVFLKHSLACGILARILAAQAKIQHTERLFVAGLLHDIGRLVWYKYFPEQAKLVLEMAKMTVHSLYEVENECMGISHEEIAGLLLEKWEFPVTLKQSIIYHHTPSTSPDPIGAGIVHMADIAVNALGLGHSGERIIPRFEPKVWELIQVEPSAFTTAINQTIQQLGLMETLFSEL